MCWLQFWILSALLLSSSASGAINATRTKTPGLDFEDKLIDDLFDGYKKSIRPGVLRDGKKDPVQVSTTFTVNRVLGTDDRLETISAIAFVILEWHDQRLAWDPNAYGNITRVGLDSGKVWTPELVMQNLESLNPEDTSFKTKIELSPILESTANYIGGSLSYQIYATVQERCAFDMTYFPFDNQRCTICGIGTENPEDVTYITKQPLQYGFEAGGEWDLVGISNASALGRSACCSLTIQRRSLYYVVNLFLPTIVICVLNTIGLFASIHTASEEMEFSSLGQTTLLSLGVLMLTVADQTPKGANQISLLGTFFLAMICQTLLASLTAVFLKKQLRQVEIKWTHQSTSATKSDGRHFWNCYGNKICLALNLSLITCITATVLSLGYSNVQPSMTVDQ